MHEPTGVHLPDVNVPHPARAVARVSVRVRGTSGADDHYDWVAVEEPLEIRVAGPDQEPVSVAVTMRTPGSDVELAVGFLYTEGLIDRDDRISTSDAPAPWHSQVVSIALARPFDGSALKRNFFASSSCGVCGKATLDQAFIRCGAVAPGPVVRASTLAGLPDALRPAQRGFDRTGGLHAAGLFDADGRLLAVREDVGRHNAVDKIVGRAFLDGGLPLSDRILLASGRAGFEILQKAAVAGVPIVCAVSAPSSLAVETADRLGITLVGFLRGDRFNIYTNPGRIDVGA
ncbi:formate dehydrogenase accessory sulfurtransferase FdhD [Paludisphaera rhizosphaerae]|uniref:formate dehydrogenase accessory sulfurtransferase FdhD n=1 Tax=Paludisphaera rhizosphaerae TaxID=2711216 RepID=UPI0013EAB507|nr:formate dehydrogenase accessory sulfurtransferase FdhD [Paludisphaera rhizosphaerae]